MILLVDIGNTCIKWAVWDKKKFTYLGQINHHSQSINATFQQAWQAMTTPVAVICANTAGNLVAEKLQAWIKSHWSLVCHFVKTSKKAQGITCAYAAPEKLGIDRWINLIAARHLHQAGAIAVVDLGTAITCDVLDANNQHQGGYIAPGYHLMQKSLYELLKKDPEKIPYEKSDHDLGLGKNTEACLQAGVLQAVLGSVQHMVNFVKKIYGSDIKIYISGGDASIVKQLESLDYEYQPNLVLIGLAVIAAQEYDREGKQ